MVTRKAKSAPKKRNGGANGGANGAAPPQTPMMAFGQIGDNDIIVETDDLDAVQMLDDSIEIDAETGDIIVDLNPQSSEQEKSKNFDDNLAEFISGSESGRIVDMLLDGIDQDERDRSEWLDQRAMGIDLLGMKLERPSGMSGGAASAPLDGMSRVRDPILLDAVLRSQANAYAELCPSAGPVKIVNYGDENTITDKMAEDLEKDLNYFFTQTASEYYPDTRNMLGMTVYASGMFKKVYWHPLEERPISESVDGADLILPSNTVTLKKAIRITHAIDMDQTTMKRMQVMGVYRNVPLGIPTPQPDTLKAKTAATAGMAARSQRAEDQQYSVMEVYCRLDLEGYEHHKGGRPTGLPLPYRVVIDKDSRTLLELRRNWDEEDNEEGLEQGSVEAKIPFVAFPYITAGFAGIYGIGLLHIMGNVAMALTAMLREGIDAGMFANFPGGLIVKPATRQLTNEIRVAPGTLAPVDIGGLGDISKAIMPLPYKDITQGLIELMQMMREVGSKVGGSAEMPVGEGKADAPVGTTLAMIEQATKVEGSVHKSFHAAQAEEFRLFKELFKQDPSSIYKTNKRPSLDAPDMVQRIAKFKAALDNIDLVPASDPNVPSHIHRLAKAQTLKQLTMGNPAYNQTEVDSDVAAMLQIDDFQRYIIPQNPNQPPDPMALAQQEKNALAQQKIESGNITAALKYQSDKENRESKETLEAIKLANTIGVHPQADHEVDQQLMQMMPLIHPQPSAPHAPANPPGVFGGNPALPHGGLPSVGMGPMFGAPRADGGPVLSPEAEQAARMAALIAHLVREREASGQGAFVPGSNHQEGHGATP